MERYGKSLKREWINNVHESILSQSPLEVVQHGHDLHPLGMKEQALHHLVKSYDEGSFYMIHLKVEPILDPLRADPRFTDLMRRVGH